MPAPWWVALIATTADTAAIMAASMVSKLRAQLNARPVVGGPHCYELSKELIFLLISSNEI